MLQCEQSKYNSVILHTVPNSTNDTNENTSRQYVHINELSICSIFDCWNWNIISRMSKVTKGQFPATTPDVTQIYTWTFLTLSK